MERQVTIAECSPPLRIDPHSHRRLGKVGREKMTALLLGSSSYCGEFVYQPMFHCSCTWEARVGNISLPHFQDSHSTIVQSSNVVHMTSMGQNPVIVGIVAVLSSIAVAELESAVVV